MNLPAMNRRVAQVSFVAVAALSGVCALVFGLPYLMDADERRVADIAYCAKSSDLVDCVRPAVRELLVHYRAEDVLFKVQPLVNTEKCHNVAHIIGQETYRKYGSVEPALGECTNKCLGGCVHGVIGEALVIEAGLDRSMLDPAHLTPEIVTQVGSRLCTSIGTCHGVGHALFQIYKEFQPALKGCVSISSGAKREFCYRGVFMEYTDELLDTNFYTEDAPELPPADPEDPSSVCDQTAIEERRPCLQLFPRIARQHFKASGMSLDATVGDLRHVCGSLGDPESRSACVMGIGILFGRSMSLDAGAVRICEEFVTRSDAKSCAFGMVFFALEQRMYENIIGFCGAFEDSSIRKSCFESTFFSADALGFQTSQIRPYCNAGAPECALAAEDHATSPWKQILRED